jgi:hypothetical protein
MWRKAHWVGLLPSFYLMVQSNVVRRHHQNW